VPLGSSVLVTSSALVISELFDLVKVTTSGLGAEIVFVLGSVKPTTLNTYRFDDEKDKRTASQSRKQNLEERKFLFPNQQPGCRHRFVEWFRKKEIMLEEVLGKNPS